MKDNLFLFDTKWDLKLITVYYNLYPGMGIVEI